MLERRTFIQCHLLTIRNFRKYEFYFDTTGSRMDVPDGACATDHWQSLSIQPTACWEKKKKNSRKSTTQKKTELTMFRRKLTALDYHNPDGFDCTGERNNAEEVSGSGFLVNPPPPTWSRLTCRNRCCCCHWSHGRAL